MGFSELRIVGTFNREADALRKTAYGSHELLENVKSYKSLCRWVEQISKRPAVERGRKVNRTWGDDNEQVRERHSAADIDKTFA